MRPCVRGVVCVWCECGVSVVCVWCACGVRVRVVRVVRVVHVVRACVHGCVCRVANVNL